MTKEARNSIFSYDLNFGNGPRIIWIPILDGEYDPILRTTHGV